jgi:squalene-hopene/tetraprenyl-beta-curcumene cyclase
MREPWIQRGRVWLEQHQNPDGGWGESCGSYEDPTLRGRGKSTPSQTAWALMGLLSFPGSDRSSIRHGVKYLLSHQNSDGSWDEHLITGTGFPRVFYLKYDMYRNNWPLLALSLYAQKLAGKLAPENEAVLSEQRAARRSAFEPAFATLASGFSSLPGIELLREILTKLNHG